MLVQLLPFAGAVALLVAWPRLAKPTSHVRLVAEVLMITVSTSAACAAVWALYWWLEQRW